ncbi:hypothetical protein CONPUDRAFT_162236 [Coniophora puteana RWD-64-598 SS2]|uniref:Elongin-A n=1 Tax=Coniophora puteana (strain RWD-64-598) TaxID=741705 RepID=A0A5M3N0W2_CONPW|nr:uncharacterized protein CONPUDRAFT_162236 [Coniophora puteana RWD-64-598 SS2]EIW84916.1 hypothetical protein CONPUDRAFT_162236 [Coniophora puteana RWD-64-598 SS2]
MFDSDNPPSRVPSLVCYCQRVASSYVDSISSLGEETRFELIQPVLESCTADTLLRLEQASPYLEDDTQDLWKHLCLKTYPMFKEQWTSGGAQDLGSWRDQFFILRAAEAERLEKVGNKLRNQRLEEAERKREREIKLTDRVPPPKRARIGGWGAPAPTKTLFQKTKTHASKIQRNMYNARILPAAPQSKTFKPLTSTPLLKPPATSSATTYGSRVTVKTVAYRKSVPSPGSASKHSQSPVADTASVTPTKSQPQSLSMSPPCEARPLKPPAATKKDPMAALFMPKHKALSQLPSQARKLSTS